MTIKKRLVDVVGSNKIGGDGVRSNCMETLEDNWPKKESLIKIWHV